MSEDTERAEARPPLPTEGLTGTEYLNAQQGYKTRPKDPEPEQVIHSDDVAGLKDAAVDLSASREKPLEFSVAEMREYRGAKLDLTESLSVDQAVKELSASRGEISRFADGLDIAGLQDAVDTKRAEVIKKDPKVAAELGVEMPADAKTVEPMSEGAKADQEGHAAIDALEGYDPKTKALIKDPMVRRDLEQVFSEASRVEKEYSAGLDHARNFGHASILAIAPELQGIPLEQWGQAIPMLAQVDPARGQQIGNLLQGVAQIQEAQAQHQQVQAREAEWQFQSKILNEDTRLSTILGNDAGAVKAANEATLEYLEENGVPRHQMIDVFRANPVLSTAEARIVLYEAAQYRRMMSSPKAIPEHLPKVARPGAQQDRPRSDNNSARIASLQKQLSTARGQSAVRIAGQIRNLNKRS